MSKTIDFSNPKYFEKKTIRFYLKTLYRDLGFKTFYQFLNRPHFRLKTRKVFKKFAPKGIGVEIGVGSRTVAPVDRTVLSDGFSDHGVDASIAKVFFRADQIPVVDGIFSFVFSEHMLEHATNPIKVLKEWIRVLQANGVIIITLPHRDRGNDRFRERTTLAHLIQDFETSVSDKDTTHVEDWNLNVVDKGLLPDHYKHLEPSEWVESGSMHHHVWITEDIIELFEFLDLEVIYSEDKLYDRRDSFLIVGRKK